MNAIAVLGVSVWYFALTAALLALVSAAVMLALEELWLRQALNRVAISGWVKFWTQVLGADKPEPADPLQKSWKQGGNRLNHLPRTIYALPPRQLIGSISTAVQGDLSGPTRGDTILLYAGIGALLLGPFETQKAVDRVTTAREDPSQLLFLAERALDDLQAFLARRWIRIRYATALCVIALLIGLLVAGRGDAGIGYAGPILVYPVVMLVGAVFAPPLRDLLERTSVGQR